MKIEITVNNITIAEEIKDTRSEKEIRETIEKITNAVLAANKVMDPKPQATQPAFNLKNEIENAIGITTIPELVTDKPASQKQLNLLKKLGYAGRIDGLSCREVANIIENLNRKNGYDYQAYKAGRGI